jgi:hypothetical protein
MVAIGVSKITLYNGSRATAVGTSVASAIAASSYVNNSTTQSFRDYLNSLTKVPVVQLVNRKPVTKGPYIKN